MNSRKDVQDLYGKTYSTLLKATGTLQLTLSHRPQHNMFKTKNFSPPIQTLLFYYVIYLSAISS